MLVVSWLQDGCYGAVDHISTQGRNTEERVGPVTGVFTVSKAKTFSEAPPRFLSLLPKLGVMVIVAFSH